MSMLFLLLFVLLSKMKSNGNNKLAFLSENPGVHPLLDETVACANHFPMQEVHRVMKSVQILHMRVFLT